MRHNEIATLAASLCGLPEGRFKGRTVDEIKPAELDRIRVQRLEGVSDERTRPVTPATVNREFAFLRRVFNIALRDEKAESNPVAKLRALREPSGRVLYLTDEEEQRLMKALPDDESRNRVHVLLHTGFRRVSCWGFGGVTWTSRPVS